MTYYVFIDSQNVYHTSKKLGTTMDYGKLMKHLKDEFGHVSVIAYVLTGTDASFEKALRSFGYRLVFHEGINRADGTCKADADVQITVDIMDYMKKRDCDGIILITNDGDFAPLARRVHRDTTFFLYCVPRFSGHKLVQECPDNVDFSKFMKSPRSGASRGGFSE